MVIQATPGINYEINEEFSFYVPGYKHMPQFKSGRWNGKVSMYDLRTKNFYRGLLPKFIKWCSNNGYSVEILDKSALKPQIVFDEKWLDSWENYGKFKPKPHQNKAIKTILGLNHSLVKSPTGSGKSYIIYMVIRYLLEHTDQKILITVPTTSLVEQLFSDFVDYSSGKGWDAQKHCQRIYSGKEKNTDHRVVISTWQSVYKLPKTWFRQFGAYLCDEAHGADSKSISAIIGNLSHASIRAGLTGTLDGSKLHELEMIARFGPIVTATTTSELQNSGDLAKLNIRCLRIEYSDEEKARVKDMKYHQEMDFLLSHERRNRILVNVALNEPKNTMMLFDRVEKHGKVLFQLIKDKAQALGKKVYYISGETDVDIRENIRNILEKESNCILLASEKTFSTGINIKNLHTIIFCHPHKAQILTLQSIGRALRTHEDKTEGATLIDIADDLIIKSKKGVEKNNYVMDHFIERLKIYIAEKFPYKIIPIPLKS